jgi:hypothetical protein
LAGDQAELDALLQNVGKIVEIFFREFPNTASREEVYRERVGIDGRVLESTRQNFNHSAYHNKAGTWEEGRIDTKGRPIQYELMREAIMPGYCFQLRSQGTPIATHDMWVASLVMQHDLLLYSRDRHFDHLPQLPRVSRPSVSPFTIRRSGLKAESA